MAKITWKNGTSGDWSVGSAWSTSTVPGALDDAFIDIAGSYAVSITTPQAVHSLTLNAAGVSISTSASLVLGGTLTVSAGTIFLTTNGIISGGTIQDSGGGLEFVSGTAMLQGVTYQGVLDMSQNNRFLRIVNGITFAGLNGAGAGTVNLTGENVNLSIDGNTTLDNATLNIGNSGGGGQSLLFANDVGPGAVLTLGSKFNVVHAGRSASLSSSGNPANAIVNQGLLTAAFSGGILNINGNRFTNTGTVLVSNGDSLVIGATTITNTGTINVAAKSSLTLSGAWSNAGKISMTDGGLGLNGSFNTAALNSITRSGGGVSIGGSEDNTGATIKVGAGAALGTIFLTTNGIISGGTIQDSGGGLEFVSGTAMLQGVTYQGVLDMSQNNRFLRIVNGITFAGLNGAGAGTVNLTGENVNLSIDGNTTLDNATLNIGNSGGGGQSLLFANDVGPGAVLTLGSKFNVVHAGRSASLSSSGNPANAIVNQGLLTAAFSGGILNINGNRFTNTGTVLVSNGDSLVIGATTKFTNFAGGTLTGGTYRVSGGSLLQLANDALIGINDADITLSGAGSLIRSLNTSNNQQVALDATLATIGSAGALRLLNGRAFTAVSGFTDNGLLELGGGTFKASTLGVAAGASVIGFGVLDAALSNAGMVEAKGGLLNLLGAVSGAGGFQIDSGATLELGSNPVAGQVVGFNGIDATLKLDAPAGFAATLDQFAPGDRLDLAGVGLATKAALSGTTLTVTLAGGSLLTYTLSNPTPSNLAITSDGNGGSLITAFGRAKASAHTPEPVVFANRHVGDAAQRALTIGNIGTANAFWENLDASIGGATAGITAAGSFAGLAPGATNTSSLKVGLDTSVAGVLVGTAKISLFSNGAGTSGFGKTALPSQTVNVSGKIYAYAAPTLSATTLNFGAARIGGSLATQTLKIGNGLAADAFQESLTYALGALPVGFKGQSGTSGTVASGASGSAVLAIAADKSGDFSGGTATLTLASTGIGTSGLADTSLASQTITLNGKVYAPAVAQLGTKTVNFGVVHVGDVVNIPVAVTNTAAGTLTDVLVGGFGTVTAPFTGSGSLAGLVAGTSGTLNVGLNTASAGTFSGSAQLALKSSNPDLAAISVSAGPIALSGTVNNYALGRCARLSGGGTFGQSGSNYTLSLGTIASVGLPVTIDLGLMNAATGPADLLSGQFEIAGSAGLINTGFANFTDLAAGAQRTGLSVSLPSKLVSGTYTETITLHSTSNNASGSSALADQTLTISATVLVATQLTRTPTTLVGGAGADTYIATSGVLYSGQSINGGGGTNTLLLQGPGTFDLRAPTVLKNIGVLNAMEGQPAYMLDDGTLVPSQIQTVYLRDGFDVTMNVAPSAALNAANPLAPTMVVYGARSASVINLGDGNDIVFVGGTRETFKGGGGSNTFYVNGTTIGATIDGGNSGASALFVRGGGTATMGTNITNIAAVTLTNAAGGAVQPDYVFRANGLAGLQIRASAGNDTITIGNATQRVVATGGNTTVRAIASMAGGVTFNGGTGQSTLEIITGGTVTLAAATDRVTVKLDAASVLTLNKMQFIRAIGSAGADMIKAGAAGQVLTGGAGVDTLQSAVGFGTIFRDDAAGLGGDSIKGFGGADVIDVTDLIAGSAKLSYSGSATRGNLTVSDGAHAANIKLFGSFSESLFHVADDGHGGSVITYG